MLDVCAQYVVKQCGGISSRKNPRSERRAPQGQAESPGVRETVTWAFRRYKAEMLAARGCQKYSS